jgi:hypothetical protein
MTNDKAWAGYCGIYCETCAVFRLYRDGSDAEKLPLAFETCCTLDQLRCEGCRTGDRFVMSKYCLFRRCAKGRGLDACAFCADFPCETLTIFYDEGTPSQQEARANSLRIKEIGIDAWLEEAGKKWCCGKCGAPMTVGDEQCRACGTQRGLKSGTI